MPSYARLGIRLILLDFIKMNTAKTTLGLPHFKPGGKTRGRLISSLPKPLLMLCLLLGLPLTSMASAGITPHIDQAIQQYLNTLMSPRAQRENWQGMRITHTSTPLGSASSLVACQQALTVSGGVTDSYRHRLTLTCPDQPGWRLEVASEVQLWLPVLVATRVIDRGQVISAADVKQQEIDITKAPRGFYHQPSAITGMGAKRRIRANQLISPALIALPLAVKRGDKVKIIANHDGITASMSGQAVENGSEGEVIRVKNLSSNKTIEAKVLGAGKVASIF